jgi:hypothetical protein
MTLREFLLTETFSAAAQFTKCTSCGITVGNIINNSIALNKNTFQSLNTWQLVCKSQQ